MKKLNWRFRKRSEGDPFEIKPCGCKVYVYDGTVVRPCSKHDQVKKGIEADK